MKKDITILIADRNPHVRNLIKREMMAEGYRVCMANSGQEVLERVYHRDPIDLVILDLDLPDVNEIVLLEKILDRIPVLPVVVHTFLSGYQTHPSVLKSAAFVEKNGTSMEQLKKIVAELIAGDESEIEDASERNITVKNKL